MKVDCNGCGASLEVGKATRFATCAGCHSRVAIVRTDAAVYTEVLGSAGDPSMDAHEAAHTARGHAPLAAVVASGGGESVLRLVVGGTVVASDLFWWMTDPSMQSLYVRIGLLAAGAWLMLSGVWRMIESARARVRAAHAAKAHTKKD